MIAKAHKIAGLTATQTIASFWLATAAAELFLGSGAVVAVKTSIPYGLLILMPAMAVAGGSGFQLAKGRKAKVTGAKRKRMPIIAANGVLILIPSAFFLAAKAQAGATNFFLMGLDIRDGRKMTAGWLRSA